MIHRDMIVLGIVCSGSLGTPELLWKSPVIQINSLLPLAVAEKKWCQKHDRYLSGLKCDKMSSPGFPASHLSIPVPSTSSPPNSKRYLFTGIAHKSRWEVLLTAEMLRACAISTSGAGPHLSGFKFPTAHLACVLFGQPEKNWYCLFLIIIITISRIIALMIFQISGGQVTTPSSGNLPSLGPASAPPTARSPDAIPKLQPSGDMFDGAAILLPDPCQRRLVSGPEFSSRHVCSDDEKKGKQVQQLPSVWDSCPDGRSVSNKSPIKRRQSNASVYTTRKRPWVVDRRSANKCALAPCRPYLHTNT